MVMANIFREFMKTFILIKKNPNKTALEPERPTPCFAGRLLLGGLGMDLGECCCYGGMEASPCRAPALKGKAGKTKGLSSGVRELKPD